MFLPYPSCFWTEPLWQVHSDDTEIIEFSYVIWDDKANGFVDGQLATAAWILYNIFKARGISRTTCLLMFFLATQFEDADGYFVGFFWPPKMVPFGQKIGSPSNRFFFRRTLLHILYSL